MNIKILLLTLLFSSGCSSMGGLLSGASSTKVEKKSFFTVEGDGPFLRGPCVNLPFIDTNYPEHLSQIIRLYEPKVDAMGAYKVTILMLKQEDKRNDYAVDTKSSKLCKVQGEIGYSFRIVRLKTES